MNRIKIRSILRELVKVMSANTHEAFQSSRHTETGSAITITKLLGVGNELKTKQNPPNLMPNSSGQRSVPEMGFLLC